MHTDKIRTKFLEFFAENGHTVVPSDSLVPEDDPTLLFTGAGMNQFKQEFMGRGRVKEFRRAVTSQKCLRTADLENVGKTAYHHTFFEMLGNFSFGDYFKKEAIEWAWEFLTKVLGIKAEKLWVSVYTEDEEAFKIWKDKIGISENKIVSLGAKENFWPSNAKEDGPNGPCGPCSEIFYDWGKDTGCRKKECSPACDCGRFVEIWNLVFTQFNRMPDKTLENLPSKNIDTGMGLERITAVMQSVRTNFEIDIFKPVIKSLVEILLVTNHKSQVTSSTNAIADHIRAVIFTIADGVMPSNESRGYVVRKLIRKALMHRRRILGKKEHSLFLSKLVPIVCEVMVKPYPYLKQKQKSIEEIVKSEEERFIETLRFESVIIERMDEIIKEGSKELSAQEVFKWFDTYGFPVEIIEEFVSERGLKFNKEEVEGLLAKQRSSSRKSTKLSSDIFAQTFKSKILEFSRETEFVGYESLETKAVIVEVFDEEEETCIILDKTSFYGEAGGQVGDAGVIKKSDGAVFEVSDTKKVEKTIVHIGKIIKGGFKKGDKVIAAVDKQKRKAIKRNHTATHLLQSVLREILGEHIEQAGSLVEAGRLRFDFAHFKEVSRPQLDRIEEILNRRIMENSEVRSEVMNLKKAKTSGATALFGEKYGKEVRVVSVGEESKELCGGTHTSRTGDIGLFKILRESSIAAGVRRIEAVTGEAAYKKIKEQESVLDKTAALLKTQPKKVAEKVEGLFEKMKRLENQLQGFCKEISNQIVEEMIEGAVEIKGVKVIIRRLDRTTGDILRSTADSVRQKAKSCVVLIGGETEGKVLFICALTKDIIKRGLNAGKIVAEVARLANGSGGGRADMAQAGAKDAGKLDEALGKVGEIVSKFLIIRQRVLSGKIS